MTDEHFMKNDAKNEENSMNSRNIKVDILKTLAIIAVVLYHMGSGILPYGYLGVDIFFVISGYYLMVGMQKEYQRTGKHKYFQTLFVRIKRLWLPILIACLVSLVIGFFLMLPDDFENLCQSVVASSTFTNNILACITTKNYWDAVNMYKPLMHLWYAGVLMQAYVVIPIILMGVFRICKNTAKQAIVVAGMLLVLFALYLLPIATDAQKFYYLPFRLFEFFVGVLIAVIVKGNFKIDQRINTLFTVVLSAIMLVLLCARQTIVSSQFMLITTVVNTGVILVLFEKGKQFSGKLAYGIAQIGKASFSIYLWHQVLIAFMYYCVFPKMTVVWALVLLAATAVCAFGSYRFLERPLHKVKEKRLLTISVASGILCLILCAAGLWGYVRGGIVRDVPELGITSAEAKRGIHAQYSDRVYAWDKDFADDDNVKVLIIGDSFGRDFANILQESPVAEDIQISYIYLKNNRNYMEKYSERIASADVVFYASSGVYEVLPQWLTDWAEQDAVYVVGTKNYGGSNGYIYARRFTSGYYRMSVEINEHYWARNTQQKQQYGDHYIDMLAPVTTGTGCVRVFTDEGKFISQDCRHLTQYGAMYYASVLDFSWILNQHQE